MEKSKVEISYAVLNQLIALQREVEEVSADSLRQFVRDLLEDLKQADDMERYRICCVCGCLLQEGYVIDLCDVYCSTECLYQHISQEAYEELYRGGEGDSYWTQW